MKQNKPLNIGFIKQMVVNAGMDKIDAKATDILAAAVVDCPVDKNNMRASQKKIRDDNKQTVAIGFGSGISKDYTIFQHENVGLHHKVGKAKWLQDQFDMQTKGMKRK